jgi:hypothetical protein
MPSACSAAGRSTRTAPSSTPTRRRRGSASPARHDRAGR